MIGLTTPERLVYFALVRKIGEGNFEFQRPFLGGRDLPGGTVADFYIPYLSLIISVRGTYWHSSHEEKARDEIQKLSLVSQGIETIYIDEEDAVKDADYYVSEALNFRSHTD